MSETCPDHICALCYHEKCNSKICSRPDCELAASPCSAATAGITVKDMRAWVKASALPRTGLLRVSDDYYIMMEDGKPTHTIHKSVFQQNERGQQP